MEIQELIQSLNFSSIAWQILTPCFFSLADVITGFIQAVINKDVDSQIMRNGLLHKMLIFIIIGLSFIFDMTFSLKLVSKIVSCYVILMETTSILENLKKSGIEIETLTEILKKKEGEKNETK